MVEEHPQAPVEAARPQYVAKLFINSSIVLGIGFLLGFVHYATVKNIFEHDRNFSHLSDLEREMSLRTEMGLYYSYYKTLVEEDEFLYGVNKLLNDDKIEYPKKVNVLSRFNIHPEFIIALMYRYLWPYHDDTVCHVVTRGDDLPAVLSCVGLGDKMYFYLETVWWLAGLTLTTLFLYATTLSGSIIGGVIASLQYLANHTECTRVMWTPNERENFAQPFLLMQMWLVTIRLRNPNALATEPALIILNAMCLLCWQFSQFILATQAGILFLMEQLYIIDLKTLAVILYTHFGGIHLAIIILYGNNLLKTSFYICFFVSIAVCCIPFSKLKLRVKNKKVLSMELVLIILKVGILLMMTVVFKRLLALILDTDDDGHILEIFLAKFTSYKSFHTLLYTTSTVFGYLPLNYFINVTSTGLLPTVLVAILNLILYWSVNSINKTNMNTVLNSAKTNEQISKETDKLISNQATEPISKETPKLISNEITEANPNKTAKSIPNETSEQAKTPELIPAECNKPILKETANQISNEVIKPNTNQINNLISNNTSEPARITGPIAAKTTNSITKETNELVSYETAETKSNQIPKSIPNEVHEPVSNKIVESILDKVNEPVSNKTDDSIPDESTVPAQTAEPDLKESPEHISNETISNETIEFLQNLNIDAGAFYNIAQMVVFGLMAILVMRLKLLFTPHLCIVSAIAFNRTYYTRIITRHRNTIIIIFMPFVAMCILKSIKNYFEETSHVGDYTNMELENLINWILQETGPLSVFAGPMPLMATVLLTTRRPIINHPHYENLDSRLRNYAVYKTYGKFEPIHLYEDLSKYNVNYLVIEKRYCYGVSSGNIQIFEYIWDTVMPVLKNNPRLCHRLITERQANFYRVYANREYVVMKLHDFSVSYTPLTLNS